MHGHTEKEKKKKEHKNVKRFFLTFPADFLIPIIFSNLNYNCPSALDLRNLQEQVKHVFCFKNCTDLSLFEYINCSSDLKQISLQQFFLYIVGQNNFGNKIIFRIFFFIFLFSFFIESRVCASNLVIRTIQYQTDGL